VEFIPLTVYTPLHALQKDPRFVLDFLFPQNSQLLFPPTLLLNSLTGAAKESPMTGA
jgi:hypothetical protein